MTNTPETAGTSTPASTPPTDTTETQAPDTKHSPEQAVRQFQLMLIAAGDAAKAADEFSKFRSDPSSVTERMKLQKKAVIDAKAIAQSCIDDPEIISALDQVLATFPPEAEPATEPATDPKPDPNAPDPKPVEPGYPDAETGQGTPPPAAEPHDKPHGHGHKEHERGHKK